jgi:DNA-directed RNA polymerase specialized sigma54-like protein
MATQIESEVQTQPAVLSVTTIRLIWQLGTDNRLWSAERIRGELLKLGIQVSRRTIQKYPIRTDIWGSQHDLRPYPA